MYEDLKAVCGEKDARYLLALAVYKLDGQGAMMNFEDWVPQVWLPNIRPIDGRRISELLKTVDLTKTENYYKRRYDRALCQSKEPLTLSFDSTGISTYSTTSRTAYEADDALKVSRTDKAAKSADGKPEPMAAVPLQNQRAGECAA